MTISVKAFEQKIGDKYYHAYWLNNGAYWITANTQPEPPRPKKLRKPASWHDGLDASFRRFATMTGSITVLPGELRQIITDGDFEGEAGLRPGMIRREGRISASANHELITIRSHGESPWGDGVESITLPRYAWRKIYESCRHEGIETTRGWGRVITPLVGVVAPKELPNPREES